MREFNMLKKEKLNDRAQIVGYSVPNWTTRPFPDKKTHTGQYCILQKIDKKVHFDDLYRFFGPESNSETWTYLSLNHFKNRDTFWNYLTKIEHEKQSIYYAIVDKSTQKVLGSFALVAIDQENGSVEIGYVIYSDSMKKTKIATEAQFLLMTYVFDQLGYRRYVWMCDDCNEASKHAATRLGFSFEGIFRNMWVYKNRNRDTAWFSITDYEWPSIKNRMEKWLNKSNFDNEGIQKNKLTDM